MVYVERMERMEGLLARVGYTALGWGAAVGSFFLVFR